MYMDMRFYENIHMSVHIDIRIYNDCLGPSA